MSDQRIQYSEEMVGNAHPTKADTLNRHAAVEHNSDGTHKAAAISSGGGILHSLATAANDFLVASGVGVYVKKTLAETKVILGLVLTQAALAVGFTLSGGTSARTFTVDADASVTGERAAESENSKETIYYPAVTGDIADTQSAQTMTNKTLTSPVISNATASRVAMYNGSQVLGSGANTDAEIADAVTKKHTQHTDTGTTATSFKINSSGNEADIMTTGLTGDRDFTLPDIDTMLAGSALMTQNSHEVIAYT